jgi:hypothetical protein
MTPILEQLIFVVFQRGPHSNPTVLDLRGSVDALAGLVAKALEPGEIEAHHLAATLR